MKFIFFSILLVPSLLHGQSEKEIESNFHTWTSINSTMRFSNHWGEIADFHLRRDNGIEDPNFYFLRIGAAYWVSDELTLAGGIAHLWLAQPGNTQKWVYQNENRIFQQVQWREKIRRARLVSRIRIEQRWHEVLNAEDEVERIRFSNRVRFLLAFNFPIFSNPNLPTLSISDEVHFHFGKEVVYNTFDQNRIFIGIKQKVSSSMSLDFGYMMVYQQLFSGYQYDLNHTLRLFFYYSPDFRKSKKGQPDHYELMGDE